MRHANLLSRLARQRGPQPLVEATLPTHPRLRLSQWQASQGRPVVPQTTGLSRFWNKIGTPVAKAERYADRKRSFGDLRTGSVAQAGLQSRQLHADSGLT